MQLVSFSYAQTVRIGILDSHAAQVVDLSVAAGELPRSMQEFIMLGERGLEIAKRAFSGTAGRLPLTDVQLLAPIPLPLRNIICIGKNYRDHVQELQGTATSLGGDNTTEPEYPIFFTKASTTVIGQGVPIPISADATGTSDYEGELGVIIGKGGRNIQATEALEHVYGYTVINDVTSRRLQGDHQQWFLGKSLDGYCPMGPAIVTTDEVAELDRVRIKTWVNDELRQDAEVASMIFDVASQIQSLSRYMTLQAGDILATGTPAGVGMGFKPPRYLKPGDQVRINIEPIGTLENPVV